MAILRFDLPPTTVEPVVKILALFSDFLIRGPYPMTYNPTSDYKRKWECEVPWDASFGTLNYDPLLNNASGFSRCVVVSGGSIIYSEPIIRDNEFSYRHFGDRRSQAIESQWQSEEIPRKGIILNGKDYSAKGIQTRITGTGDGASAWQEYRDYKPDRAGFGWHQQTETASGFGPSDVLPRSLSIGVVRICGDTIDLDDKTKAECQGDADPSDIDFFAGLVFEKIVNLRCTNANDIKIVQNATFDGGLDCTDSAFRVFDDSISVSGPLYFSGCSIEDEITTDLSTVDRLHLDRTSSPTKLSEDIPVSCSVSAVKGVVWKIPEDFENGSVVDLTDCPIRSLPSGLSCGVLRMRRCRLDTLPSDLIADELDLSGAIVEEWPDSLDGVESIKWDGSSRELESIPQAIREKVNR